RLVHGAELAVVASRPVGEHRMGAVAPRAYVGSAGVAVVRAAAGAVGEDAAPHRVAGVGRALLAVVADARGAGLTGAGPLAGVAQRAGVVVAAGGPRAGGRVRPAAAHRIARIERTGIVVTAVEGNTGHAEPARAHLAAVAHVPVRARGAVG